MERQHRGTGPPEASGSRCAPSPIVRCGSQRALLEKSDAGLSEDLLLPSPGCLVTKRAPPQW